MNWMRVHTLTRRRNLYLHGQITLTRSLEKWVDHVDLSRHDTVTGSAKDESVIFRKLHSETLAYSKKLWGSLYMPYEDIMIEMDEIISMLLEEISQKVWQDIASPLDLGHWTTPCKETELRGAGHHSSYWPSNGHCYSDWKKMVLLVEDLAHTMSATHLTQSPLLIKKFFAASC